MKRWQDLPMATIWDEEPIAGEPKNVRFKLNWRNKIIEFDGTLLTDPEDRIRVDVATISNGRIGHNPFSGDALKNKIIENFARYGPATITALNDGTPLPLPFQYIVPASHGRVSDVTLSPKPSTTELELTVRKTNNSQWLTLEFASFAQRLGGLVLDTVLEELDSRLRAAIGSQSKSSPDEFSQSVPQYWIFQAAQGALILHAFWPPKIPDDRFGPKTLNLPFSDSGAHNGQKLRAINLSWKNAHRSKNETRTVYAPIGVFERSETQANTTPAKKPKTGQMLVFAGSKPPEALLTRMDDEGVEVNGRWIGEGEASAQILLDDGTTMAPTSSSAKGFHHVAETGQRIQISIFPPIGDAIRFDWSIVSAPTRDVTRKKQLTICIDLGASSIAAAAGYGSSLHSSRALRIGEHQEKLDPAHAEQGDPHLISSTVGLTQEAVSKLGRGGSSEHMGFQTEYVGCVSGPDVYLELPFPSYREIETSAFHNRRGQHRDGLTVINPNSGQATTNRGAPTWALEGYKDFLCNQGSETDAEHEISDQSGRRSKFPVKTVFNAALRSLLKAHILPLLLQDYQQATRGGRSGHRWDGLDLSETQLILTYPSGLPKKIQLEVYQEAAMEALDTVFPSPTLNLNNPEFYEDRVRLISEARATAFYAATRPTEIDVDSGTRLDANVTYPAPGLNRLIIADIGKSTADFCIATFCAQIDANRPDVELNSFKTTHEFGTTLGGRFFDQCFRAQLESVLETATLKDLRKNKDQFAIWEGHQDRIIAASKARWSRPDFGADDSDTPEWHGAVEIDLAWVRPGTQDRRNPIRPHLEDFVSLADIENLTGLTRDELEKHILELEDQILSEHPVEFPIGSATNDYAVLLTNQAPSLDADGRPQLLKDATSIESGWRLVLRGTYDWFMPTRHSASARSAQGSSDGFNRLPHPVDYKQAIEDICNRLARLDANKDEQVANEKVSTWILLTGRTTLYRAFQPGEFAVLRRRLVIDEPDTETNASEILKSIVVDGALSLDGWGLENPDIKRDPKLSFALVAPIKDNKVQSRNLTEENGSVASDEVLTVGPPISLKELNSPVVNEYPILQRSLFRNVTSAVSDTRYEWVPDSTEQGAGFWRFFKVRMAGGDEESILNLYTDGRVERVA